ncbi:hypothetical protein D1007_47449 [Hordeum vulgare]|nr:hypothetical protein D1007_47449 [Hordeum vulgare]
MPGSQPSRRKWPAVRLLGTSPQGPRLEQITTICAKERLDEALVETRARAEPRPDNGAPGALPPSVCLAVAALSGAIPLGVREDAFSVDDMDRGEYFLSMSITDRCVNLSSEVIIVYGPADHSRSAEFLAELKDKVDRCSGLVVAAGDFNLIRHAADKSLSNIDRVRMHMFNDCIADLAL